MPAFAFGEVTWRSDLTRATHVALSGNNRNIVRRLCELRGEWYLEQGKYELAIEQFREAVRRAHEVNMPTSAAAQLVLARHMCGELSNPRAEAEEAENILGGHLTLARLWLSIGDLDRAKPHAWAAYRWASADGEPYVHRWELIRSRTLLNHLGIEPPPVPKYRPERDRRMPWEDDVLSAVQKLNSEWLLERVLGAIARIL